MLIVLILFAIVFAIGLIIRLTEGELLVMGIGLLFYPGILVLGFYYHWGLLLGFWLAMTVLNTAAYKAISKIENVKEPFVPLLFNSLVFWPVQLWLIFVKDTWTDANSKAISIDPEILKQIQADKAEQIKAEKLFLKNLPSIVEGVVSFEHHLGSVEGHEILWLDELPDMPLYITSKLYDEIGIEEGKQFRFDLVKKFGTEVGVEDCVAWIVSGNEV